MKHRLSQILLCLARIKPDFKQRSVLLSLPLGTPLLMPWQPGQESVRWFLMMVMALIVLLFIAVAVLLPITLRLTQGRQKKKSPAPAPTPAPEPPLPNALIDTVESAAVMLPDEDLAATQPGLRSIRAEREPETLPASGPRPAQIGWQIAGLTDTGLRRELNEDSMLMWENDMPCGLYVVADGMGGHDAGEVASRLTINAIQQHFTSHPPADTAISDEWLSAAVTTANETVLAEQGDRTEERKMGSTLVMALVADQQAHIANVGDSRAYRISQTGIEQISVDHSLVERLVQIGQLTREEARTHKQKNVIYSTIGDKPDMDVSFYHVPLQPGDRLLLCSDGLCGMITDEEILAISRSQPDPAAACRFLIEAAKRAGGHDNITAIIVQMRG